MQPNFRNKINKMICKFRIFVIFYRKKKQISYKKTFSNIGDLEQAANLRGKKSNGNRKAWNTVNSSEAKRVKTIRPKIKASPSLPRDWRINMNLSTNQDRKETEFNSKYEIALY